ncbi:MAG: cupin domain-containing protein [Sulfuricaulis sp.]|nr:cupin domain-containing protein [Sulfuricaulis sp.]
MKNSAYIIAVALITASYVHAVTAAEWVGPDEKVPGKYSTMNLEKLLDENKLPVGVNFKAVTLSRSELSSHLLVQVRNREPLHYHNDSDISVWLLRGRGLIHMGNEVIVINAGDMLHIPRGVIHAYVNQGKEAGVALVVFSPPPSPKDRVLVDSPSPP